MRIKAVVYAHDAMQACIIIHDFKKGCFMINDTVDQGSKSTLEEPEPWTKW